MMEEPLYSDEVSSIVMEGSINTMMEDLEYESSQSNVHVKEDFNYVDKDEVVKETNGTPIVFKSLRPSQESATIKPRQKICNVIKSKKANTLLQAKKVMFKAKKDKKTSTICSTSYSRKRKPEQWLELYLFGSNVDKKNNKFETGSLTLKKEVEEFHTTLTIN